MDATILAVICGLIVMSLFGFLATYLFRSQQRTDEAEAAARQQETGQAESSGAGARRGATDRMRRNLRQRGARQQRAPDPPPPRQSDSDRDDDDDDDDEEEAEGARERLTKKEERRREREEAREAERAARTAREAKSSAYNDRRAQKDREREARERAQEEEMLAAASERQRLEDEEAARWMNLISVEQAGHEEVEGEEGGGGALSRFVDYVIARKTVELDELAAHFGMRTGEVVERLMELEGLGRLTGVLDERGKFIYISPEEMAAVADHMRRVGRVSIASLARVSTNFIDLQPKAGGAGGAAAAGAGVPPAIDFDSLLGGEAEVAA